MGRLGYRPELDGLRAVAIAAVVLFHVDHQAIPGGYLGVDVFFVLSGFLITSRLLEEHELTGRIDLVRFWRRRVRRLAPALLIMVCVVTALFVAAGAPQLLGGGRQPWAALLYVSNWTRTAPGVIGGALGHTWSLAIEEQFYLVWPLVLVAGWRTDGRRGVFAAALLLATASALWRAVIYDPSVWERTYFGLDTRFDALAVGCALAAAPYRPRLPRALTGFASVALGIGIVTVPETAAWMHRGGFTVAALLSAAVIAGVLQGHGRRGLSLPGVVTVGLTSYGLYLWHEPMLWLGRATSRTAGWDPWRGSSWRR